MKRATKEWLDKQLCGPLDRDSDEPLDAATEALIDLRHSDARQAAELRALRRALKRIQLLAQVAGTSDATVSSIAWWARAALKPARRKP